MPTIIKLYDTYFNKSEATCAGLRLDGFPTDIKEFYLALAEEGCHPKATHRILGRLKSNGFDLLTIMVGIKFNRVADRLGLIGVKMTFVQGLDDWKPLYEDGKWPDWALPQSQS